MNLRDLCAQYERVIAFAERMATKRCETWVVWRYSYGPNNSYTPCKESILQAYPPREPHCIVARFKGATA